ncbi:hypothetical protein HC928_13770 [bacterium]|nr:hypothetical protein [bacterium]
MMTGDPIAPVAVGIFAIRGQLGMDWGVCANPASPRASLLTFEHQGCQAFEADEEND